MCNSLGLTTLLGRWPLLGQCAIEASCVKCYVTEVKPGFNEFALKNVLGDFDEQRTLRETLFHHIQWPRKEIVFIDEIPEAPPKSNHCRPSTGDALVATAALAG